MSSKNNSPFNMKYLCVDVSGSTSGCTDYYNKVNKIMDDLKLQCENENCKFNCILWSSYSKMFVGNKITMNHAGGGTSTYPLMELLYTTFNNEPYDLIIITDGQLDDSDLRQTKAFINEKKMLDYIKSATIYFIGYENFMNTEMFTYFKGMPKKMYINDITNATASLTGNEIYSADIVKKLLNEFTLDNLLKNSNDLIFLITDILTSDNTDLSVDIRKVIKITLCKIKSKLLIECANRDNDEIGKFYKDRDIEACMAYIRNYKTKEESNATIITKILTTAINLIDKHGKELHSLYLYNAKSLAETEVKYDEEMKTESDDDDDAGDVISQNSLFACDILYSKHGIIGIPIVKPIKPIFAEDVSKKYAENPWAILSDKETIHNVLTHVEHNKISLDAYKNLPDKKISPYTRRNLHGIYLLYSKEGLENKLDDNLIKDIINNNNYMLTILFGSNKIPGNKSIWNIVFLYIIMKYHNSWKEYNDLLKQEIVYISSILRSLINLKTLFEPVIESSLDASLWYVANVSHKLYPTGEKNIIRSFGISGIEFVRFYDEIFEKPNITEEQIYVWHVWLYVLKNRDTIHFKLLAQFQDNFYDESTNQFIYFFGKCPPENRFNDETLKLISSELNFGLYLNLNPHSIKTENIDITKLNKDIAEKGEMIKGPIVDIVEECELIMKCANNTNICESTGFEISYCIVKEKKSGKISTIHYKLLVKPYSLKDESYFRTFRDFCLKNRRYPENGKEILYFHSGQRKSRSYPICYYRDVIYDCFDLVYKKHDYLIKSVKIEDFIPKIKMYNIVEDREATEIVCKCESHKIVLDSIK